jgi:hypothetical protein
MHKMAVLSTILIILMLFSPVFVDATDLDEATSEDLQNVFNQLNQSEVEQVTEQEKNWLVDFWAHLDIFSPASLQIPPPSQRKQVAYIMVGDTSSNVASAAELFRKSLEIYLNKPSVDYFFDKRHFKQQWVDYIVSKSQSLLQAAGYNLSNIRIRRRATAAILSGVLKNPTVGALIWTGHGQPGKVIDMTHDNRTGIISEAPVRRWALDFLKEKGIYKLPANYPRSSGMFKAMAIIENQAHFGLNYFYSHSCYTMKDKSLAIAMLAGGGRYEGYTMPKLAYVGSLTPFVSGNVNQDLPDVHSLAVVPDVKGLDKTVARNKLTPQGFTVEISEDQEDEYSSGQVYAQHPAEGTILDKYRSKMHVKLNVYKSDKDGSEAQDDDSQGDENSENDSYAETIVPDWNSGCPGPGATELYTLMDPPGPYAGGSSLICQDRSGRKWISPNGQGWRLIKTITEGTKRNADSPFYDGSTVTTAINPPHQAQEWKYNGNLYPK